MLETRRHGLISWLASTTLTVAAVGLFVLSLGSCNRDGQEMAGGVIAQNDVFTMTGDSIIEDTVYATATGPDYIKTNVSLQGIEAIAHRMMGDSRIYPVTQRVAVDIYYIISDKFLSCFQVRVICNKRLLFLNRQFIR